MDQGKPRRGSDVNPDRGNSFSRVDKGIMGEAKLHETSLALGITSFIKEVNSYEKSIKETDGWDLMEGVERLQSTVAQRLIAKATLIVVSVKKLTSTSTNSGKDLSSIEYPSYSTGNRIWDTIILIKK